MGSIYKNAIGISVFGESHGPGIGGVLDGFPSGLKVDMEHVLWLMNRRKPGKNKLSTSRKESDVPEILSGIFEGYTTGAPISFIIRNNNTKSKDYSSLKHTPRPSHGDYTGYKKYKGFGDYRGGGHFSGRLTAPIVFMGALCEELLMEKGIYIVSKIDSIGDFKDDDITNFDIESIRKFRNQEIQIKSQKVESDVRNLIERCRVKGDSIGGSIKTYILGVKAGIGNPMFDTIEGNLAKLLFAVPGVKAVEFGLGTEYRFAHGSQVNDEYYLDGEEVKTYSNYNGGILGGITTGMAIEHKVTIKPTPSIFKEQRTVDLEKMENTSQKIEGRHDPCIVPRAVPVIESISAISLVDILLEAGEL